LITPTKIICANAGDSRSVLAQKGKAVELSHDHKPDNPLEKDRIMKAGGEIIEGRINGNINLSRAIGDLDYKQNANLKPDLQLIISKPDIIEMLYSREDKDFIVMGCDGIWEIKTNQEIVDFVISN